MINYSVSVRKFEIGAALLTGVLHVALHGSGFTGLFIGAAALFWIVYVIWRIRRQVEVLREWGFRVDNLNTSFKWPTLFFLAATIVMALIGVSRGHTLLDRALLPLLVLYPLWGVVQQFLVQSLFVSNLTALLSVEKTGFAVVAGVVLFGLVHYPRWIEVIATAGMAAVFIPLFLNDRNLWPLGLYHGWLGSFFHVWVLGRNPWFEIFG